jgi:hypothetical protein
MRQSVACGGPDLLRDPRERSGRAGRHRRAGEGLDASASAERSGVAAGAAHLIGVVAACGEGGRRREGERDAPSPPAHRSARAMSATARAVPSAVPVTLERPDRAR